MMEATFTAIVLGVFMAAVYGIAYYAGLEDGRADAYNDVLVLMKREIEKREGGDAE